MKFDIKPKSFDRVLYEHGVHVPTIFVFSRSNFGLYFINWKDSYKSNACFLIDEHRRVFDTKGEHVLLPIGASSRVFLLVPSSLVRRYLKTKVAVPEDLGPEIASLYAIEASAILAGALWRFSEKWPDVWPVLGLISDRFSCATMNMAMFNYSAVPFHLYCKLNMEEFIYALKIVDDKVDGVTSVDCLAALDRDSPVQKKNIDNRNGVWFCMESQGLAAAIVQARGNPRAPEVLAYLPFIKLMEPRQD